MTALYLWKGAVQPPASGFVDALAKTTVTNYVAYSHDFTQWSNGAGTPVKNVTTIEDDNAAGYESAREIVTLSDIAGYTSGDDLLWQVRIGKDNTGAATRFPMIRLEFRTEDAQSQDICLDTSTGDINARSPANGVTTTGYGVIDEGDCWHLWVCGNDGGAGNSQAWCNLFPAGGANADLGTLSSAAVGTITVRGAQLTTGTYTDNADIPRIARNATSSTTGVSQVFGGNVIYINKGAVQESKFGSLAAAMYRPTWVRPRLSVF